MPTQEFYIRNATDTEARGPFNYEQLSSLAENGQVTAETLYYEATTEEWRAIGANPELMTQLFPEKRRLKVKPKEKVNSLNQASENAAPIEVNDMLAAAEGRSEDTRGKADPTEALARAAKLGMYACTLALLVSAAALIAPSIDLILTGNYLGLLRDPFALLGLVDLVLFLLLALQMVSVYPFVRFRAALGCGFLGLVFWSQIEPLVLLGVVAGSVGLYLTTVFTRLASLLVAVALALGGMGWFAYTMLHR